MAQLEVAITEQSGRNVVLRAACGMGKTTTMALPAVLNPDKVVISISPLKLIQENHIREFEKLGIRSFAMNGDTSKEEELWKLIGHAQYIKIGYAEYIKSMAEYANLSTPDPEIADELKAVPPITVWDPTLIRASYEKFLPGLNTVQLPEASEYILEDRYIDVADGVQVLARCITPNPKAGSNRSFPLLFWLHGGAFMVGDVRMNDYPLRKISVDLQISIVNCEYRLAPEHPFPAAPNDCYTALKFVAGHPKLFSASLSKGFIVAGASAGANLAAVLANRARDDPFFRDKPITGQALQVPFVIHPEGYPEKYKDRLLSLEQNKDAPILNKFAVMESIRYYRAPPLDPDASPLLLSTHKNLPPAYIQVCGADPLRDDGFLYQKVLEADGVETKLDVYPGIPHGLLSMAPGKSQVSKKYAREFVEGLKWLLEKTS